MTLTDAAIYKLPKASRRVTIRDTRLSQLVLTLGPMSRAWYLHATVRRQTRRVALGRFPLLSVEDARKKALDALRKLYGGEDPRARSVAGLTLRSALDAYLSGRKLRDSSASDCRGVVERHGAKWLDKPLSSIGAEAVAAQYRVVSGKSVSAGNKLLATV